MMQDERICSWADALIAARLVESRALCIPFLGTFESVFHKEYIYMNGTDRVLVPPRVSVSYKPSNYVLARQRYTSMELLNPDSFFEEEFVTNLADLHGCKVDEVRRTLEEYSISFLKGVFRGRKMAFLGLGAFYARETSPGCLLLYYEPFKALLSQVNQPFSVYKPTVIPSHTGFSDLEEHTQIEEDMEVYPFVISSPDENRECGNTKVTLEKEPEKHTLNIRKPLHTPQKTKKTKNKFSLWLILVLGAVVVFVILVLLLKPNKPTLEVADTDVPVASAIQVDTVSAVQEKVMSEEPRSDEPILEEPKDTVTISNGVTLAKLARAYYGNSYYWVYIYMANEKIIGNPDNIPIGSSLIVPPLSWYGIDEVNDQTLKEAKTWATLILTNKFTSFEEQRGEVRH